MKDKKTAGKNMGGKIRLIAVGIYSVLILGILGFLAFSVIAGKKGPDLPGEPMALSEYCGDTGVSGFDSVDNFRTATSLEQENGIYIDLKGDDLDLLYDYDAHDYGTLRSTAYYKSMVKDAEYTDELVVIESDMESEDVARVFYEQRNEEFDYYADGTSGGIIWVRYSGEDEDTTYSLYRGCSVNEDNDVLNTYRAVYYKGDHAVIIIAAWQNEDFTKNLNDVCDILDLASPTKLKINGAYLPSPPPPSTLVPIPSPNVPADPTNAMIHHFYNAILLRYADESGMEYYKERVIEDKGDPSIVVYALFDSEEFDTRELSDEEYIQVAYNAILYRNPEDEEVEYYMELLNNEEDDVDFDRDDILDDLFDTEEWAEILENSGIRQYIVSYVNPFS